MVDRYVSPTGSDGNNGLTPGTAYLTIGFAAGVVNPGDVVHVAPGTYPERIQLNRSGTSSDRIRFVSDTKWGALVTPTGDGPTGWGESNAFRVNANYITIEGFHITPATGATLAAGIYLVSPIGTWVISCKMYHISVPGMPEGPGGISADMGTDLTVVTGNHVYDIGTTTRTHGIYIADGDAIITNNIVASCTGSGIVTWHTPGQIYVHNNTVVNCGTTGVYSSGGIFMGCGEHPESILENAVIANNIVAHCPSMGILEDGVVLNNNSFINNICYNNAMGNFVIVDGTQSGSQIIDPLFVSYSGDGLGDYHVLAGSPAIGAGSAIYAPAVDFDGNTRSSSPDIGAYEFFPAATGSLSFVGAGTPAHGDYNVATTPSIPAQAIANDLLVCFTHLRSNGTVTSTWATHVFNDASVTCLLVSYKIATGGDAAPTITPVGALAGQHHSSCVLAFRGVDVSAPFGTPGTAAQYASAEDIGPIAAATATTSNGVVIVFGARNDAVGTSLSNPGLLTGDSLTWIEAVDAGSVDNFSHIVVDYAIWSGATPTLTAKTFDIPGGTASAVSAGVMLLLNAASPQIAYVGVGAATPGVFDTVFNPPLPSAIQNGDLLITFGYIRNAGTFNISAGWTQHSLTDVDQSGQSFYLQTWYRRVVGGETAPTLTIVDGSIAPQTLAMTFVTAFRGVDQNMPFGVSGADSFNAPAFNVGPIAAPLTLPANGAVLCLGVRYGIPWTSVLTLSGDGLTWFEEFDNYTYFPSLGIALVLNHAMWAAVPPTITAKTFVPTAGDSWYGFGKMLTLNAAGVEVTERTLNASANVAVAAGQTVSCAADCNVLAATGILTGPVATADHDDVMTPSLPSSIPLGSVLLAFGYLRNAGTLSISAGWAQHSLVDTFVNGSNFYLRTWYCIYDGSQVAPTITTTGGSTSPQTLSMSFVIAAYTYNTVSPFAEDGADSFFPTQANIGPIAVPPSLPNDGTVFVLGIRNGTPWTSVPTLSGDSLTWNELFDLYTNTVAGLSIGATIHYATWRQGVAPTLTAKTFAPVGGASAPSMGKMFVLNASPLATRTVIVDADVVSLKTINATVFADCAVTTTRTSVSNADLSVAGGALTSFVSADAVVNLGARALFVLADTYVASAERTVVVSANSVVVRAQSLPDTFLDAIVGPSFTRRELITFADSVVQVPTSQPAVLSAIADISAQYTDTAWLVLLTLDHPDLPSSIRVTSDGVPTMSGGFAYSPFPFDVILPDDVEGRPPQAQLRIDNTTQEIIALLRGLVSPPKLTVQIVRSVSPDVVEFQWIGLDWTVSSYDKSVITGTLTVNDLSREEFPYITFDGRWRGLWP